MGSGRSVLVDGRGPNNQRREPPTCGLGALLSAFVSLSLEGVEELHLLRLELVVGEESGVKGSLQLHQLRL